MNFRLALAAAFLFNSCILIAQQNLQPGYIVPSAGDTLKGFIDYKEWSRNPLTISFSPTFEGLTKVYSNKDIKHFAVSGRESYHLYKVRISMDTRVLTYLPEKKDTTNRVESVFLRVIQAGKNITLYSYNDDSKLRWYILERGKDTPKELLNSVYRNGSSIINDREYRSQLEQLATAYLPLHKETSLLIERANYSKKTILNICDKINEGSTDKAGEDDINKEGPSALRFFAGIGANLGFTNISGASRYSGQSSSSLSPLIGAGVDVHIFPDIGRLYLRNTLTFTTNKSKFTSGLYTFQLKQSNFSLHSQLNYNFYNKADFKWFGGAGAGLNISSYPTNTQVGEYGTITEDFLETETFWINMTIQSGFAIKNIEISVSYFLKSDLSQYVGYGAKNSAFQFRINYLFKRKIKV